MNGASAAPAISQVPVAKRVGAVRIGKRLTATSSINPDEEDHEPSRLDPIVAGTDEAILMVEAGANGVTEADILDALDIAHGEIKKITATIEELRQKIGQGEAGHRGADDRREPPDIRNSHGQPATPSPPGRQARALRSDRPAVEAVVEQYSAGDADEFEADAARRDEVGKARRDREGHDPQVVAVDKKRPDGRAPRRSVRSSEVDVSPAFTVRRSSPGRRRSSNVALGTTRMDMRLDNPGWEETKTYWHHYNFPPFSVGEAGLRAVRSAATSVTAPSPSAPPGVPTGSKSSRT